MKQKLLKSLLLLLITLSFFIFIIDLFKVFYPKDKTDYKEIVKEENFDPSFSRLNSMSTFTTYCDSLYGQNVINPSDSERYATLVYQTLRTRFYHGYSHYSLGENSLAYFSRIAKRDLDAIVIPNDILKHPMAACSQQSIIGMEVFKRKGFDVRKVGFFSSEYGGHFCFEVFFNNRWHFFDPDLEPEILVMEANHFPSISEMVSNDSLLHKLYPNKDRDLIEKLFRSYFYGPVNKFPAPNARVFQYAAKYLSYFAWILLLVLYFILQKSVWRSKKKEKCAELPVSLVSEKA